LTPGDCADGFSHDGDRGCEPVLPAEDCIAGQMAIPGETTCHEVAPCASGTWGDIPIDAASEHVDISFIGMSDGSSANPWGSIQAAVDAAVSGAVIAIAEGSYVEDVVIVGKAVRLWGRCPALVEVVGTGLSAIRIEVGADASEVRSLAIRGGGVGVLMSGSLDVVVDSVWIHDNDDRGVDVEAALGPSSITVRNTLIEQFRNDGIYALGAAVSIEGSVVRDALPASMGVAVYYEPALDVAPTLRLIGSLVERTYATGVLISGGDGTIAASVVRDTELGAQGVNSRGISVQHHPTADAPGSLDLSGSLIERSHDVGVLVAAAEATLEAIVVRDITADGTDFSGTGIAVSDVPGIGPSAVTLTNSLIDRSRAQGALSQGSNLTIEATVVRDIQPGAEGNGRGVVVQLNEQTGSPGVLVLRGSLVERALSTGVFVQSAEATIEATIVRDTQLDVDGLFGRGVTAQPHAIGPPSVLTLRTSLLSGNHEIGVHISGAQASIEASEVRDMLPNADGLLGRGVNVQPSSFTEATSTLVMNGSLVQDSQEIGIAIRDTVASLDNCVVEGTRATPDELFGDGLLALSDMQLAHVTLTGVHVIDSARAAVSSFGATISLSGSSFVCQRFDFNGEPYFDFDHAFENLGGNLCGCPSADKTCKLVSAGLEPPAALAPSN
jgi:hypothetical protein